MTAKLPRAKISNVVRTIFYNILILFVFANVFYWSIPVVTWFSNLGKSNYGEGGGTYKSFIEWRTGAFDSPDRKSSVGGRYLQRRTLNQDKTPSRRVYFFGGSTMWGFGAIDDGTTIPSQFAALTALHAENFADIGWTAHQGLIYLIQVLQDGNRPDVVIFFDGANDVAAKCRIEHSPTSHGSESEFRSLLSGSSSPSSFTSHFKAVVRLAERVNREIFKAVRGSAYDCDTDAAKADAVATNLVRDWQMAKQLVELYGGEFVGILQPVAYFSQAPGGSLNLRDDLGLQFKTVYPLVRRKILGAPAFHDFGSIFDIDENVYIDFCHVNARGNQYVAREIANLVAPKEQ